MVGFVFCSCMVRWVAVDGVTVIDGRICLLFMYGCDYYYYDYPYYYYYYYYYDYTYYYYYYYYYCYYYYHKWFQHLQAAKHCATSGFSTRSWRPPNTALQVTSAPAGRQTLRHKWFQHSQLEAAKHRATSGFSTDGWRVGDGWVVAGWWLGGWLGWAG